MKRLFKFFLFVCIAVIVVAVLANMLRRKATGPSQAPATRWEPPTVVPPVAAVEPTPEVAVDTPMAAEAVVEPGENVAQEETPPASVATPAEEPELEAALMVADDEGMTPPPGEPPEDVAISSEQTPVVSELASPEAAAATELEAEASPGPADEALMVADDEGMASSPSHESEDMAVGSGGTAVISELAGATPASAALEEGADAGPGFGAVLDEAEEQAERAGAAVAPSTAEPETEEEPDVLTRYLDEVSATPEEPESPAEPDAKASLSGGDEGLLTSVEEALEDLEPAPIVPPPRRTAESYLDEGNVYFNVGQYGLAIERYGQAIALDGQLTAAFYNRANAHTRAGEFDSALADYDRALALQPNDADALNNRGMLHLYRANYGSALADFNGALEADPSDSTVMVNRGLAHLHNGDSAAALADFREAARMDNNDAAAQYGAAQAAATMGDREGALGHVTRALELDPGYAREAAADARLQLLQGDEEFLRLLRQSGSRSSS